MHDSCSMSHRLLTPLWVCAIVTEGNTCHVNNHWYTLLGQGDPPSQTGWPWAYVVHSVFVDSACKFFMPRSRAASEEQQGSHPGVWRFIHCKFVWFESHALAVHYGGRGDVRNIVCNFARFLRERLAGTCASTKLTQHSLYNIMLCCELWRKVLCLRVCFCHHTQRHNTSRGYVFILEL